MFLVTSYLWPLEAHAQKCSFVIVLLIFDDVLFHDISLILRLCPLIDIALCSLLLHSL